ncbi:hypothetical protein ACFOZ0_05160 [Streptomyces yaanensis]|uniref:P68 RBP/TagC-like beta-propeller domain-containing protein n=1 Tax=Streptomyces yaanensis TaxID=1142239 RepID=A0ABV7S8L8_9ACTN|nr:hypothetical protein [Streptomyces sp. CGMCC 4.7035]WNC00229.1 hypothetical protein Q2K21_20375 [Streptomyces sp. CGMCC 4.7035]
MIKLAAVTPPLLAGATLASAASVAQSVYWESVDQYWYVCQPDSTPEDLYRVTVSRLTADGALVDKMSIGRAGHGANLGVERDATGIYLWTDAVPSGGWATAVARIPYVANGTADASDASVVRTPRTGVYRVSATIDPTRRQLIFRWQSNDVASPQATGGIDRYDLAAAAAGTFTRLQTMSYGASGKTLQGYTSLGDYVYHLYGDQNQDNVTVTCMDWASGTVLQSQHITAFAGLPYREAEGICVFQNSPDDPAATVAFGIPARTDAGVRQLNLARFPHPGTNPWVPIPYSTTLYKPNSDNYIPQYRLAGDQVFLHFSLSKVDGTAWAQGETLFQLPLRARPDRTQRLLGVVSGAAVTADTMAVRFEVTTDGKVSVWDERTLVGWIGGDVSFWVC